MADFKLKYGTTNQAIDIDLEIAAGAAQESDVIDNTSLLAIDRLVQLVIVGGAGSGYANIYAYASTDGATYSGGATGINDAITLQAPPNLAFLGSVTITGGASNYSRAFSLAAAFGGSLPQKVGIVVENKTANTFAAGGSAFYQDVLGQSV